MLVSFVFNCDAEKLCEQIIMYPKTFFKRFLSFANTTFCHAIQKLSFAKNKSKNV